MPHPVGTADLHISEISESNCSLGCVPDRPRGGEEVDAAPLAWESCPGTPQREALCQMTRQPVVQKHRLLVVTASFFFFLTP